MSGTPAACAVLAAELQRLRTRHDLSLAALAERTPFSQSSWGRYLGGKALPPWQAVQHLCALVDEPEERFRALWTVAESAPSRSPDMPADPDTLRPALRRGAVHRAAIGVGLWPVVLAGPFARCLAGDSWSSAVDALAFVALAAIAYFGLGVPVPATVPRWERWCVGAVGAAVVADVVARAPRLRDDLSLADAVVPALALALAVVAAADRLDGPGARSSPLNWPLGEGDWQIVEGDGRLLNHHWSVPAQRGALDIVGRSRGGRSSRPLFPRRLSDYPIYRVPVLAPAAGTVVSARDGAPDHPTAGTHPAGNHVVIDTGRERILLAHLAPGSVRPARGERVRAGQPVGLVGSSGNSTEPHLHVHAVRDGEPLALVFHDAPGGHRRGVRARVRRRPADGARGA
ncbi:peptidoglycan DD-metalloendopeptidase family protein [Streptacidiphilus neutrinimicus]|uniref:peptidoglycan DD-metalloendopeptidase family protein n=1 Tax=Streptacidiphilus neutrinimicus TaxID=105420 RepID=UPI00069378E3|nr:peptidoglycan DD-metalloendopeptidase family protein [Streptacidiphilus neutrinimicus]